jgi:hypothetical protein
MRFFSILGALAFSGCSAAEPGEANRHTIHGSSMVNGKKTKTVAPTASGQPPALRKSYEVVTGSKVADAASVAFPSGKFVTDADGVRWTFANHQLILTGFGYVLVSEGKANEADYGHVTSGRLDITYLSRSGADLYVKKRYPEAVQVGSFGAMSEWSISPKFGDFPVVYAAGGFTGQGVTEGCTVLTELTSSGPIMIAAIPDSYSSPDLYGAKAQEAEGKIQNIDPNKSFEVRYSGSAKGTRAYVRQGSKYVPRGKPVLDHCGENQ